jgi:nucleoside-diphosphate-sugar epimerase
MRVLVTGASGFIGCHVCETLRAQGIGVRAITRSAPARDVDGPAASIEWIVRDLLHASDRELSDLGKGVDACIHAAWCVVPGEYLTSPKNDDYRSASLRLFTALLEQGCGMITGVGTCFEYEQTDRPLNEAAPLGPATPYAEAKLATYRAGEALARQANASFAWARLFYLYGPREDSRRLVASVARCLLRGERVAVTSGNQIRDFLHVADVAAALTSIATSRMNGPVNVGSGQPVRVRDIVRTIGDVIGRGELIDYGARPENAVDPPYVCADNRRLRTMTAWSPRYGLEEGLRDAITWWRNRA